jgi:hypothetical protein
MDTRMKLSKQVLAAAAAVGIAAAGGSAFTGSNTMPTTPTSVGQGVSNVSGYTVSNVAYTLGALTEVAEGDHIQSVTFDTVGADVVATNGRVRLVSTDAWTTCVRGTSDPVAKTATFTCSFSPTIKADSATQLDVVLTG